jgi:hypothetical protein
LVELGGARQSGGGIAAHAQLLGKFGGVNVSAEALLANDFHLRGGVKQSIREFRAGVDAPIRLGRTLLPVHADVHLLDRRDGTSQLEATARLGANFDRFNLATDLRYRRQYVRDGSSPPAEIQANLIGSGHVGDVRLRGAAGFDLSPATRFRTAELSAYWSKSDRVDWEAALAYEAVGKRARARLTHVSRLNTMSVALTGEAATDGAVAVGINLSFSLDPGHGFALSRRQMAQSGAVHATVYRDLNDNGLRDPAEPFEKGALITTGTVQAGRPTDARGAVTIAGLTAYSPVAVGIDETSLADPMLAPRKALQVVVPRPGVAAEVEIGLVGGGDVEGAVTRSGGLGFEGLDLELLDAAGRVVATARSDYDGFFLFERVAYGRYRFRLAAASAGATGMSPLIEAEATLTPAKPVARVGPLRLRAASSKGEAPLKVAATAL